MNAAHVVDALQGAGLSVSLKSGGALVVSPGSRLTPDLRELVKINKAALVDWLEAANDPASAAPPALVQPPAPAKPVKLKYLEWADGWLELDKAYQRHHWSCPQCQAAGRRANGQRCGVGAALYRAYEDASADRSALDW